MARFDYDFGGGLQAYAQFNYGGLMTFNNSFGAQVPNFNRFTVYAMYPQCSVSMHILPGKQNQNTVFGVGPVPSAPGGPKPSLCHTPEKSGLPLASRGAGASRFGLPSRVRGTPAVGYRIHCASSAMESAPKIITNRATRRSSCITRDCIRRARLQPDVRL